MEQKPDRGIVTNMQRRDSQIRMQLRHVCDGIYMFIYLFIYLFVYI
jgi:hypothetical protein